MSKNYQLLAESIKGRINPENFALKRSFTDELSTISYSEVLTYIRLAMKGVEPEYTQRTKDAGEKVKQHLANKLTNVSFRYQGSVMTDTHIKGFSDIDLLTITDKFYFYDAANTKDILTNPDKKSRYYQSSIEKLQHEVNLAYYTGNPISDLRALRQECESILTDVYTVCDTTKPKSIKIINQTLNREVDIVIANWYDDVTSIINDKGDYRGVQIYNKASDSMEQPDYPFLSIQRINERSSDTNGRLKRMIRFLKNVKANSDMAIDLSSFDINAVCYDINVTSYQNASFYELVPVIYNQLKAICTDQIKADSIVSVDGREYIFRNKPTKLNNLKNLLAEVEGVFVDLRKILGI